MVNGRDHKYDYLSQERQEELGLNWVTFRYRNADPAIGRFFGVDPISEDYMSISTYQFAHNNPVWKVELEGLEGGVTAGFDSQSYEPVTGHTNVGNSAIPIGDSTAGNYGTATATLVEYNPNTHTPSGVRTSIFDDFSDASAFQGELHPATDQQYADYPVEAVMQDVGFMAATLIGADAVDNAVSTALDPNVSTGDKVKTAVAALPALVRGKGGAKASPNVGRQNITRVYSTRKRAKDARPRPKPIQKGQKRVTRQTKNKKGEGNKMKTDRGSQTPHFHDTNHNNKNKPNMHYRVGTKKVKPNEQ